jgi:uncharacterized membrane protein
MTIRTSWLGGLGLGAALMYLLDPERGRRRRAMMRDGISSRVWDSGEFLEKTGRDLGNRARGLVARARGRVVAEGPVDDEVLAERVRSKMGRSVSHPGSIEVIAQDGRVTLRGPILADEVDALLSTVRSVRGVREVDDGLEVHSDPGRISGLQGGGQRRGETSEFRQEHWSPAARFAAGTAGGALTVFGLRRFGKLGGAATAVGAGLLARSIANKPARRLTGVGAGRRAVDYRKTITVEAPVDDVYELWSQLENFPRFMSHIREVRDIGDERTLWTAVGPAGVSVSWVAVVTAREPGKLLAWRSEPESMIDNAGTVRFEPVRGGEATRVDIHLSYNPPAGAVGDAVANLLGVDPKSAMDEDLGRFKSLLEEGRTTNGNEQVTPEELEAES